MVVRGKEAHVNIRENLVEGKVKSRRPVDCKVETCGKAMTGVGVVEP